MTKLPGATQRRIPRIEHGRRPGFLYVVIHTVEGNGTLQGAENWFRNPAAGGVGAHVGVDDKRAIQWADLDALAWHASGANTYGVGFEHAAFSAWKPWQWNKHIRMLKLSANRAAWVCYHYRRGEPKWGHNVRPHASFPAGGHTDPGPNFPMRFYMHRARVAYMRLKNSGGDRWTR